MKTNTAALQSLHNMVGKFNLITLPKFCFS